MLIKCNNDDEVENNLLKLFETLESNKDIIYTESVLLHILSHKGNPTPPNAKPLKGHKDLNEIRLKFGNTLYRINYFVDYEGDCMVILNWYTKPDGKSKSDSYNKSKKKKLDRMIQNSIEEAKLLQKNYYLNIGNYELYH